MNSQDTFLTPAQKYRGTELWMLNDALEKDELKRQIKEMREQGFYSFIARTYIGHKSDYPGPGFKEKIAAIIEGCREYGMKVFLQAGYMPGGVPDLPEEYTHTAIRPVVKGEKTKNSIKVLMSKGGTDYTLVRQPYFLDMLSPEAMDYYIKTSYDDFWNEFRNEFGKSVLSVWVDEPHFCPPDLPWTPILPEEFKKMWGYDIVGKLNLLFEKEEGYARVRYQYWRTVLKLLQNAYFKQVSKWCGENNLLFSGHLMGEDTLLGQIANICDCMPLYKYFDIPGIDYLTADMDWKHGQLYGIDDGYRFVNTPLQCSSAAHQAGKSDVLCEMFGVSAQNLTFADQKYIFDHFASMGVNHKMVHGVFYSLRGRGKRAYPPHINYYQPYWKNYGFVNDYFARVSWFISQGKPAADILVLHPVEAAFCEYDYMREYEKQTSHSSENSIPYNDQDRKFNQLLQNLLGMQVSFELGDEETIEGWGNVSDTGRFVIGRMDYGTVILPDLCVVRRTTLKLLERFAEKGGKIIVLGQLPAYLDGEPEEGLAGKLLQMENVTRVPDAASLGRLLLSEKDRSFHFGCSGDHSQVIMNYREEGDKRHIFVFNGDRNHSKNAWISIRGEHTAERWKGEDGSTSHIGACISGGRTRVYFRLEAGGSAMFVFDKSTRAEGECRCPDTVSTVYRFNGGWEIKRKDPNVLVLEFASYKKKDGAFSPLYPIRAIQQMLTNEGYHGPITLRFPFNAEELPANTSLALESPEAQTVRVNNTILSAIPDGYYWDKAFETLKLGDCIVQGENTIEIEREFAPLARPKTNYTALFQDLGGVELESLYLIGDFGVKVLVEPSYKNCIRFSRHFTLTQEPSHSDGELTILGYPFYAGTMVLSRKVTLDRIPEGKAAIRLEEFSGCLAKISVNGKMAGRVAWAPYEADVTGLLDIGENSITIEITNTLRNLLGPYHRPAGDPGYCWSPYNSPDHPWMGEIDTKTGQSFKDWYDHREPDSRRWTDAYLQVPFGLGGMTLSIG